MRIIIGYSRCPVTVTEFRKRGHEAWTCDLLPAEHEWHLQGDVWDHADGDWGMGIFHPMCTYLTVSAAWAFKDGPYHQKVKPGTLVGAARRAAREAALDNFRRLLSLPYPKAIEKVMRRTMVIGQRCVPVANLPYTLASDAAGLMAESAPFAACYFDRADGQRVFSLRSRGPDGADVGAIAASYGGGGHRNAAGFQMPIGWEGDDAF